MGKRFGIAVSPGVVVAKAFVLDSSEIVVKRVAVSDTDIPREIARFEDALTKTRAALLNIRKKIASELGREHSEIFNAHLLILEDRTLIEEVISRLREEKYNVEYIFSEIIAQYTRAFAQVDDTYLKERTADIKDIGKRIIANLMGKKKEKMTDIHEQVVIVSHDLSPSETAMMNKEFVVGFATDVGGPTSHTAIMARSLEIPAVVGLRTISSEIMDGDTIIIDGNKGVVIVNPSDEDLGVYRSEEQKLEEIQLRLDALRDLPAETTDGHSVELAANIEFASEVDSVLTHGANGVGLFRTEYMYINRVGFPTEEEQFSAYKAVAEGMQGKPVVIRTLDLGGDKFATSLDMPKELNSFMGWRAIRFCLTRTDIFKTQLRALLRASVYGNIKVMFPLISSLSELRKAKDVFDEVREELKGRKIPFNDAMEVGIMVEVPSAAVTTDLLAREVDFFSIGSNDLIQYSLAVDRGNEKVAYLYQPTHPAILRLIEQIVQNGHRESIWVGICGEMAADPALAVLLLGLGVDEMSVSAVVLPKVKKIIRSISRAEAVAIVEECKQFATSEEIELHLQQRLEPIMKMLQE